MRRQVFVALMAVAFLGRVSAQTYGIHDLNQFKATLEAPPTPSAAVAAAEPPPATALNDLPDDLPEVWRPVFVCAVGLAAAGARWYK